MEFFILFVGSIKSGVKSACVPSLVALLDTDPFTL